MREKKHLSLVFLALLTGWWLNACKVEDPASANGRFEVGIYNGSGAWEPSVIATHNAVTWAGFTTDFFDQNELFSDGVGRFDVVIIPGGDPRAIVSAFGEVGRSKLQSFVLYGGSYIGLGAGAAITDTSTGQWPGLGFLYGLARWPCDQIAAYTEYTLTEIVKTDWDPPLCRICADRYFTLYRWGPELMPASLASLDVIYNYRVTGTPAIAALNYGSGRVALCGVQIEIEENDARDSTSFGSELLDPDSEWDIIEEMLLYCISDN